MKKRETADREGLLHVQGRDMAHLVHDPKAVGVTLPPLQVGVRYTALGLDREVVAWVPHLEELLILLNRDRASAAANQPFEQLLVVVQTVSEEMKEVSGCSNEVVLIVVVTSPKHDLPVLLSLGLVHHRSILLTNSDPRLVRDGKHCHIRLRFHVQHEFA